MPDTLAIAARRALQARVEKRDRKAHWTLCPRPICDNGKVYETINGVRRGPGYTCSVCGGVGFVNA
jgi:hypothetical protein